MLTAQELRDLLEQGNLSQRGAAKALDIDERMMRRYCAGEYVTPRVVEFAIRYLIAAQLADASPDVKRP